MPRGGPDWGVGGQKKIVSGLDDQAELAARLGSPVRYHRGGDVIYTCTFENGEENMNFSSAWSGADWYLSGVPSLSGGVCLMLKKMNADIYLRPIELTTLGFEVSFVNYSDLSHLSLVVLNYFEGNGYNYSFTLDLLDNELQIDTEDEADLKVDDYTITTLYTGWFMTMKGVVDLENNRYHHLYFNHLDYNLVDYNADLVPGADDDLLVISIEPTPTVGGDGQVAVDNVIVTINEP